MNCAKCKTSDTIELMADSGASVHLTHVRSDLSEYEVMELDEMPLMMASTEADLLYASGKGSICHRQRAYIEGWPPGLFSLLKSTSFPSLLIVPRFILVLLWI